MIEVFIENSEERIEVEQGISLQELSEKYKHLTTYPILGALVNNCTQELNYRVYRPKRISFFDVSSRFGYRMYINSVAFMLYKAVKDLYPQANLYVEQSLLNGLFCRVVNATDDNVTLAYKLKEYMSKMVEDD